MPSCLFPICSSEWRCKRGCSQHEKQCLVQNKSQVHCKWCSTVRDCHDHCQVTGSLQWRTVPHGSTWAASKVSDTRYQLQLGQRHRPVRSSLPSKSSVPEQDCLIKTAEMNERERDSIAWRKRLTVLTHISQLMTIKDFLSPDCPSL